MKFQSSSMVMAGLFGAGIFLGWKWSRVDFYRTQFGHTD